MSGACRWTASLLAMAFLLSGCSSSISVSLTPSAPQATDQGVPVVVTATVTNSSQGVNWSLRGAGSLSGSTGPSTSYIPPTSGLTGGQQATVIATSIADPTKSASLQITVNPAPTLLFQTIADGTVGLPYSQPIVLNGGTPPIQWSIYNGSNGLGRQIAGSLPDGLTLNATTGVVSGTPTGAGTWYFEATATDADGVFLSIPTSIQIDPASTAAANPVPFLNQPLVPASVSPGSNALTLKVSGTGFISGVTIDFNGTPLATTFVDSEHLSALLPATDVATAKTASVTVVNPAPGGGASNTVYFQVGAPKTAVSFVNAPNSPLQAIEPFGMAIADFNQDGKPDLAITANVRLYVMTGNGDGTFTAAPGSPSFIPSPPYNNFASPYTGPVTVGDFNNSGHAGLAVMDFLDGDAVILLGNGNGTFTPSSAVYANTRYMYPAAIQAADFNADGNLDLVAINSEGYPSFVLLGYGKGAFNQAGDLAPLVNGSASGVAVGDFNGDGKLDTAVSISTFLTKSPYSALAVSLGNGDGTFTQANGSPISVGQSLSAIVTGDFNGDGKLDFAVTDGTGNAVFVLLGNGDGTFQPPLSCPVGNGPEAIVAGDFNNDGKLDLAVANFADNTVTLLLGNGDGTFTPSSGSPYAVGKGPYAIGAADFNNDGKLDLIVENLTDNTVSILLHQ